MRFALFGTLFAASHVEGLYEPMDLKEFIKFLFKDGMDNHDVYSVWEFARDRGPGGAERIVGNSCSALSALARANGESFKLWAASLFPDLEYAPPPPRLPWMPTTEIIARSRRLSLNTICG